MEITSPQHNPKITSTENENSIIQREKGKLVSFNTPLPVAIICVDCESLKEHAISTCMVSANIDEETVQNE